MRYNNIVTVKLVISILGYGYWVQIMRYINIVTVKLVISILGYG